MASMKQVVQTTYESVLKVKKSDSILILSDKNTKVVARHYFEYGLSYGAKSLCLEVPVLSMHGEEPSKEVVNVMKEFDVLLFLTTKSLTHTKARKAMSALGKKILSMPGVTEQSLKRCVAIDYKEMNTVLKKLENRMKKVHTVRVTTKLGTDISFQIYNDLVLPEYTPLKKGGYNNLPIGEIFVSPLEKTANGVYVVDASHAGVGLVDQPIRITIEKGYAVLIEGDKKAKKLHKMLEDIDKKGAFNFAEFGIGTNPKAKVTGSVLEDEKIRGTCHFALGNNASFGGKVSVPIHLDGVIKKPTIYFDEKVIMKDGKLLI